MLGDNPKDISYLIGFGDNYPQHPHHRTAHASWTDSLTSPTASRHDLVGALVGGPSSDDSYEDDRGNYINNEVTTDYNSGFTSAVARLSMDFGGSVLANFPIAEVRGTEFRVQAKLNSSGTNYVEVAMRIENMSAWPAREADNLRARYYVDISEAISAGYNASDITVSTAYSQAASVSALTLLEGNTYYVDVSFEGINIYPGGQSAFYKEVQLRIAGPTGTRFWDNSNDPSWSDFTGSGYMDAKGISLIDGDNNSVLWGEGFDSETPVTETPVTETPVTETPVTETPVTETPVTETPVTETPVTETPITETPVTETPVTETPVTETPSAGLTCSIPSVDAWSNGFVLNNVKVTNTTGAAITNWEVKIQLQGTNIKLGNNWNSAVTLDADNILTVTNASYNGSLQNGASATFGLQGSFSSDWQAPACVIESTVEIPVIEEPVTETPVTETPVTETPVTETPVTETPVTETPVTETPVTETPVTETPVTETPVNETPSVDGTFRINDSGKLTKSGEELPMNCVSWFGLEGQFEPKNAENNAGGAPMEMYVGNMWWANSGQGSGRTIEQTMQEIVAKGVNLIRVPIAPQTLDETNEQGIGDVQAGGVLKNHEDVRQLNSRQALTDFIIAADKYNLNVIIDIHSCSNYLGWRAGDLEATPPYVDANREDYDYTREDYACGTTGVGSDVTIQEYNEEIWKDNLAEIAGLSKELGVDNIVGVDIFNEPWNYTWAEWKRLSESAYQTISTINDDMVIVVEGVGSSLKDGTAVEHGSDTYTPNWGENLYGFTDDPLNIPKDRLILSPHTYGPSVFVQNHFLDQNQEECKGLDGDAAGEAGCDIVINPASLQQGWDEHFGYLREQGYAVLIGEFGGMMDWPLSADTYYKNLWSHASSTVDKEWQTALVDYMVEKEIEGCYWSLNPESADTGGLYEHAHVADSNEAGWGEWLSMNTEKLSLLEKLWNMPTTGTPVIEQPETEEPVTETPVTETPVVTTGLTCTDGQADIWPGGVVLNNYKVTNTGSETLSNWEVDLDFGNSVNVTNIWNASSSTNDNVVTVTGNNLAPGQSANFGFQADYAGSIQTPSCTTVTETPVTETPVTETPVTETPVTETPVTETPVTETPVTETPVAETPVTETPVAETPVTETPVTETPVTETPVTETPVTGDGLFRVDDTGNITKAGEIMPMNCVSWFGLEGQFEPKDAANNAGGAPMELYVGNMWWANSSEGTGRTIEQTMQEIVAQGINVIRVPIAPQTLDATNEQGIGDVQNGGVLKNHASVRQLNSRQALTDFIIAADKYDLNVIIDIHSCSNYLGWRAGDLEATPPYVDADRKDYDYTREEYACGTAVGSGVIVQEYNEEIWKQNLAEIAGLSKELGVDNIIAVDIFNEPWNYTWAEWKRLSESAYATISAINDDMLIMVEGIGSGLKDGTEVEHGSDTHKPNWGENLFGFAEAPLDIPKERLILSPHTYGPSVFVQNHFLDQTQSECKGLDGDAAGEAGCDIIIDGDYLAQGWDEHFGYLREQGYAVVIGEFGGLMDWPLSADTYYKDLWSHASSTVDREWQTALVDYMSEKSIQGCYWSLNPESADTGGLFKHAHSESNAAGWGEWLAMDEDKLSLLEKLWK